MILIEIVMAVAVHIVAVAAIMSVVLGCWGLFWFCFCPVISILISWWFSGFIM
jgi:diphthamide biosynthesis methyltransferase